MKTNLFLLAASTLLVLLSGSCNRKQTISCGFMEGTVVAKDNGNSIEWVMNKNIVKSNVMQAMLQLQKVMPSISDTLVFQSVDVLKDNNDYVLECRSLIGIDKTLTIHIGLKKNNNNELVIEFVKNNAGNKTIEGCIGNHCSYCKLTKGKGCSCNTQGNCDHIVVEIPLLL